MNCDASVNNATVNIHVLWKPEVKPGDNEESASSDWLATPAVNARNT